MLRTRTVVPRRRPMPVPHVEVRQRAEFSSGSGYSGASPIAEYGGEQPHHEQPGGSSSSSSSIFRSLRGIRAESSNMRADAWRRGRTTDGGGSNEAVLASSLPLVPSSPDSEQHVHRLKLILRPSRTALQLRREDAIRNSPESRPPLQNTRKDEYKILKKHRTKLMREAEWYSKKRRNEKRTGMRFHVVKWEQGALMRKDQVEELKQKLYPPGFSRREIQGLKKVEDFLCRGLSALQLSSSSTVRSYDQSELQPKFDHVWQELETVGLRFARRGATLGDILEIGFLFARADRFRRMEKRINNAGSLATGWLHCVHKAVLKVSLVDSSLQAYNNAARTEVGLTQLAKMFHTVGCISGGPCCPDSLTMGEISPADADGVQPSETAGEVQRLARGVGVLVLRTWNLCEFFRGTSSGTVATARGSASRICGTSSTTTTTPADGNDWFRDISLLAEGLGRWWKLVGRWMNTAHEGGFPFLALHVEEFLLRVAASTQVQILRQDEEAKRKIEMKKLQATLLTTQEKDKEMLCRTTRRVKRRSTNVFDFADRETGAGRSDAYTLQERHLTRILKGLRAFFVSESAVVPPEGSFRGGATLTTATQTTGASIDALRTFFEAVLELDGEKLGRRTFALAAHIALDLGFAAPVIRHSLLLSSPQTIKYPEIPAFLRLIRRCLIAREDLHVGELLPNRTMMEFYVALLQSATRHAQRERMVTCLEDGLDVGAEDPEQAAFAVAEGITKPPQQSSVSDDQDQPPCGLAHVDTPDEDAYMPLTAAEVSTLREILAEAELALGLPTALSDHKRTKHGAVEDGSKITSTEKDDELDLERQNCVEQLKRALSRNYKGHS